MQERAWSIPTWTGLKEWHKNQQKKQREISGVWNSGTINERGESVYVIDMGEYYLGFVEEGLEQKVLLQMQCSSLPERAMTTRSRKTLLQ